MLAVTSMGASIQEALGLSYQNADLIDFENKHYRRDIEKIYYTFCSLRLAYIFKKMFSIHRIRLSIFLIRFSCIE